LPLNTRYSDYSRALSDLLSRATHDGRYLCILQFL